jgi:hypothetical protein
MISPLFWHVRIVAKSAYYVLRGRLSVYVRLYGRISAVSTGRIYVKFDSVDFYENLSRKPKFGYNGTVYMKT